MSTVLPRPLMVLYRGADVYDFEGNNMAISNRWVGIGKMRRRLKSMADAGGPLGAALFQEGETIMGKAKKDTPVDTGRLRSTGHVKRPEESGKKVSVELAFGTDYAVFVHEIDGANHPTGRSKFLEANVLAAEAGFGGRVADRMEKHLQRGLG